MTLNLTDVDYDWEQAFSVAADPGYVQIDPKKDIAEVVASIDGENDELDWQAVIKLKDGTFAWISSWCDYSGWDCRSGGSIMRAETLEKLFNPYNMPQGVRKDFAPLLAEKGIKVRLDI